MATGKRKVKPGQYYTERGKEPYPEYKNDLVEVLHVSPERYVFCKVIYFPNSLADREETHLTGYKEAIFKKIFKPLSKQKYLRRIISEGIDLGKFDREEQG